MKKTIENIDTEKTRFAASAHSMRENAERRPLRTRAIISTNTAKRRNGRGKSQ